MKEISVEEVKDIELDILRYVDCVCRDNGLTCFLSGGTLIGAVRHKGFIPWDDDIDIMMLRPDYEKLIDILKNDSRYKALSLDTTDNYYYMFAKIVDTKTYLKERNIDKQLDEYGVYIDVFPIDNLPDDANKRLRFVKTMVGLRNFRWMSLYDKLVPSAENKKFKTLRFPVRFVAWRLSRLIGWRRISVFAEKYAKKYRAEKSNHVACVVGGYGVKEICSAKAFSGAAEVEFEGEKFSAPIGYDEYLTNLYGDYMKLPPREKQVAHHDFEAYWR